MNLNEINRESQVNKLFEDIGWITGRIIAYSKSNYIEEHPNNLVVFNAKVIVLDEGLVWSGDLDIDKNIDTLNEISIKSDKKLYIMRESDLINNQNMLEEHIIKKSVVVI